MPKRRDYTPEQAATISRMTAAQATCADMALATGISPSTLRGHLLRIGLLTRRAPAVMPLPAPEVNEATREPLPAGHPVTWGLLTAGSLLEGARYPFPVRLDLHMTRISSNSQVGMALRGVS